MRSVIPTRQKLASMPNNRSKPRRTVGQSDIPRLRRRLERGPARDQVPQQQVRRAARSGRAGALLQRARALQEPLAAEHHQLYTQFGDGQEARGRGDGHEWRLARSRRL